MSTLTDSKQTGSEKQTLAILEDLTTALVSDILDGMGYRQQVMDHRILPLRQEMKVAGRAFTIMASTAYEMHPDHYDKLFESYNHMKPNDVIVIAAGGFCGAGIWGELLSLGAVARGAKGAVIDGLTRDPREIARDRFPCFALGSSPVDSGGRLEIMAFGTLIACGGVQVKPGDYILGDEMGVVIIPNKWLERWSISHARRGPKRNRYVPIFSRE